METQSVKNEAHYTQDLLMAPQLIESGVISVYSTHVEAERAVKEFQKLGFDMKRLSIVGRDFQSEENIIGFYNMGSRTKYWGKLGAFWGGLWGLLFGSAFFIVPGVGPLVVAGYFVSTLVGVIEGALVFGGLSVLGAALYSIGIPKNSIIEYESAIRAGKYLMIAHGTEQEISKARDINKTIGASHMSDFKHKN